MKNMKVLVIGGFLGSGKTSTILRVSEFLGKKGVKVAIIVNEIGEVGIDGDVISSYGFDSIELTSGCICCTLKRDLRYTINAIIKDYNPDFLLIEPTGIAFPAVIRDEIMLMNLGNVDFAPLVTLIDGSRFKDQMKEIKQFSERQIIDAEILAINKVDIVEDLYVSIIESSLKEMNPKARIVRYSAKSDSIPFSNFMDLLLENNVNSGKNTPKVLEQPKEINSITASGMATYAAEFILIRGSLNTKDAEDISCILLKKLREKIAALNPSFIGHVKSVLKTNTATIKASTTAYYEEPQVESFESFNSSMSVKILAAVSNIASKELIDSIDFCVQEVFTQNDVPIVKNVVQKSHKHKNSVEIINICNDI
ncbi:GTP-binding protein [Methanohalophilus sp.]|uniref:GTP-binding protein n=1 Tax=Methanohalophilus sp. TaxID=1966352 RepID=UPI002604C4CD|nr:GTP-binding protein [Methanohalophilus sp.]MDK2891807.1 hypothetical protein [Methanohalophilus sp.]